MKTKQITPLVILLLSIITIITSCSKAEDNKEFPDVTSTEYTVAGTVKYKLPITGKDSVINWPYKAASIEAFLGVDDVICTGAVNSDGTFVLTLPATLSGSYFSSLAGVADKQGGTLKATPQTTRIMGSIQFRVNYSENGAAKSILVRLYKLKTDNSVDKSYFYNFYDSDGTFTGTGTSGNTFNWVFTKGWGLVESYVITAGSSAFSSKSVNNALPDTVWINN